MSRQKKLCTLKIQKTNGDILRKVIVFILMVFISLALIPIIITLSSENSKTDLHTPTNDTQAQALETNVESTSSELPTENITAVHTTASTATELTTQITSDIDNEYIVSQALSVCDDSYCDEGIKAILAICKNNYIYNTNSGKTLTEASITSYSDEFYQKVETLLSELDTDIKLNGETVYIPYTPLCHGNTEESADYPYIKSVASPWDCQSPLYMYTNIYDSGVSIYGIDYLCKEGYDAKNALRYYLPDFDIK